VIDRGRHNVLGVLVDAVDMEAAASTIVDAAREGRGLGVSALAVHGVMSAVLDKELRARLNALELVVPDGQPVRWALNLLHGTRLQERVYGPDLTLEVCRLAAQEGLGVFLFGSREITLEALSHRLVERFPTLDIRGYQASRFRPASEEERCSDLEMIRASNADLVLVGLGCPRQEIWAYENRLELSLPVLAVGAAFDFHAGTLPQAPSILQRWGLEWTFRLRKEPRRLWRRYILLNPAFLLFLGLQLARIHTLGTAADASPRRNVRPS
jgi:exopolysaccharide biosynthesis WecB/TagA/CpsF family protein